MTSSRPFSGWLVCTLALACGAGCGSAGNAPLQREPVLETPATTEDVEASYAKLIRQCGLDGFISRSLKHVSDLEAPWWWTAPTLDPASLASAKTTTGWQGLMGAAQLGTEGVSDRQAPLTPDAAARCAEVRELFTPLRDVTGRDTFAAFLLYADGRSHAPLSLTEPVVPTQATVRVLGYLEVVSGIPQFEYGEVVYHALDRQYLPVQFHCEQPLTVDSSLRRLASAAAQQQNLDPASCRPTPDDNALSCWHETLEPLEGSCTFVAIGVPYRTKAGVDRVISFGGHLTRERVVVDRVAFH